MFTRLKNENKMPKILLKIENSTYLCAALVKSTWFLSSVGRASD